MDVNEYATLVNQMRVAQKEYFKTRDYGILKTSKRLEKQVDTETKILMGDTLI